MSGGVDIATLGLEIRSDGVVVASGRLRDFQRQAGQAEEAVDSVKGAANSAISTLMKMAAALGATFAVSKMREYLVHVTRVAGQYEMMGIAMHTAGRNAGYSAAQMDKFEEALKKSGIAAIEAREAMTRLAASGVELEKSSQLARAAQDLAVVGGINSSEAFERLSTAIAKGQSELLDGIGIAKNFQQGYEDTAKAIGRTVESLSENEKMQSRINMVLEDAAKFQGIYEKSMTSAEKQQNSLTRHIQTYEIAFGKAFQPAYLQYVNAQTENYKNMTAAVSDPQFQQSLTDVSVKFADLYRTLATKAMDSLPGLLESVGNGLDEIPGAIDSISVKIKGIYEFYQTLPDELIGAAGYGILGRMLFGSWKIGLLLGAVSDIYSYIQKSSGEISGRQIEIDKLQGILNSQKTTTASDPIGNTTRQRIAELKQEIQDIQEFGRVINEPFERLALMAASSAKEVGKIGPKIPAGLFDVLGDKTDIAAFAMEGLTQATEENITVDDKAAKAAENHAAQIQKTIDNLKFQISIVGMAEDEQQALNAVYSAGETIQTAAGKAIYNYTKELNAQKKAIDENGQSWEKYNDFMSGDQQSESLNMFHESSQKWIGYLSNDIDELEKKYQEVDLLFRSGANKNFELMTEDQYLSILGKLTDEHNEAAKKIESTWENTRNKIQDITADFFSGAMKGDAKSFKEFAQSFGDAMVDATSVSLAESFMKMDWKKAFEGIDKELGTGLGGVFKSLTDDVGFEIQNLIAVAATLYNTTKMTKAQGGISGGVSGAQAGGSTGNWYAAVAGGVLGASAGYMLGDNGPSYGETLASSMKELIETLKANTLAIADQILKTDELTLAQDKMQRSIFSTKMEGVNATLAGAFKIPEEMERRSTSAFDKAAAGIVNAVGTVLSYQTGGYSTVAAGAINTAIGTKDHGYTSSDYNKTETSAIISDLIGKIGLPDFITLMKQTSNDAGALIDKLVEVGYITAEIPERVLEYYSGGSSKANRIEKVADAIFEVMLNGIMELSAGIDDMNLASEAFAKTWADKSLTSKAKDMQDWQDTMNVFSGEGMKGYLAQIEATRDALLSISDEELTKLDTAALEDHFKKISALDKVLTDSVGKIEEAEQTRIVIEQYYADARSDILAGMTEEMDIASGKYSKMEQSYMSIMDAAEKYRLELVDQGMEYQEAGAASKEYAIILKGVALATQLAADTANYESRILQEKISRATTLGKTDELQILNQELINNNRKAEVQALMDTYKAGTPAYLAMIKLAKETWGVEDAANNATGAMAKVAEAMEGMWTKDSEAVAKGWWLQLNEALGRAFTPTLFLDSLGLGKESGLEGLLSANSMEEVDADLRELITLWRTGAIKEDQANFILSKINENAATIGQKIDDLANSLSQQREIGKASQEWYDSFFADSGLSELDKSLKDAGDTLEDFRQQIRDAGGSVRAGWEAGGTIETAVKDAIRSNFLADFRSEFADAVIQSDYMQSKASISKQAGDWEKTYLGATVDPEIIAARIAAINTELEANLTILNQQAIARAGEEGVLKGINESITILSDNAQNSITTLQGLARSEEELAAIRQYAADQTRQLNMDLLNNIRGTAFDITGDTDILTQQLIDLATDWQKADAQDYGAQYDILMEQNNILTQLRDIQKEQLEETIGNYNALQDVILELQGGSMAPVQSKEFFDKRYAQLYEAAQSGKSSDINNLTGFISQYADFMSAYGDTNYKDFTASIISDFEALQGSITGGATLDDLNAQLEALNSASSPIVSELIRIGDILAGLTGSGSLTQAIAFDEQAYLKRYADVAAAVMAGQFSSGLEHYQEFGASEGRLPGFARGGSFIAGENGAEIVNIGSGSSARIFNSDETAKIIADAVSKAIGGAVGGGNVTVHVSIDGKAIAPSMVKVIQTNTEAQYQIKRVANGR